MKLEPSNKRKSGFRVTGKGFILYGNAERGWFERWYSDKEKAMAYAKKRNWNIENMEVEG